MTDTMPIIIPTQEKVDAMLKGTSHKPDEVVGKMTPARRALPLRGRIPFSKLR